MLDQIPEFGTRRVLIVDDDVDGAESWAMVLGQWGYHVDVAHDGLSALHAFQRRRPDAVLLDLGLPIIDGYEVARRFLAQGGVKPLLLAVSGRAQPLDQVAAKAAGIDMHFAKPTDPEKIRSALKQLDERPS